MNGQSIVTAVVNQGGFDVSSSGLDRTDAAGWCGEVYNVLVVRSQWLRAITTLATTVAGQADYDWPAGVADVEQVRDTQGGRYGVVSVDELWDLSSSDLLLDSSSAPVIAPHYSEDGLTVGFTVWPTPATSGTVLEGLCTLFPEAFADDAGFTPVIPEDYHSCIIDGAIRVGRRRVEEQDVAVLVDDLLSAEVLALRARKLSQGPPVRQLTVLRRPR